MCHAKGKKSGHVVEPHLCSKTLNVSNLQYQSKLLKEANILDMKT
jgi:hypothetical protein